MVAFPTDVTLPVRLASVVTVAALPVMLMPQVPLAPEPVVEGTLRFVCAPAAVVAPVPPLATATVPVTLAALPGMLPDTLPPVRLVRLAPLMAGREAIVVAFPTDVTLPVRLALVVTVAALPVTLMPQVPLAPEPVVEGTPRAVCAPAALEAPVPPLAT